MSTFPLGNKVAVCSYLAIVMLPEPVKVLIAGVAAASPEPVVPPAPVVPPVAVVPPVPVAPAITPASAPPAPTVPPLPGAPSDTPSLVLGLEPQAARTVTMKPTMTIRFRIRSLLKTKSPPRPVQPSVRP